ncbi:hypothetical protein ACFXGR_22295 [Streptomyces mirabilis]|uniref:hypothetical protein n=1 Tax=Streptomyces mirabilis TaxID=68239 RepID=UPI00369C5388
MSTNSPTIPAETARHVLWHFGADGGWQPGSYTQRLMDAFAAADMTHTAKLANEYPDYAAAFMAAQYDPDGIANLQRIAGVEAAAGENPAPQCPEALFNPEYPGGLLRCVAPPGGHDVHQTPGGAEWRVPVDSSTEVPF